MTVVVDAGPLIDIDRGGRSAARLLAMIEAGETVVVSAGVLAQVVREPSRQAPLMQAIKMLDVAPLAEWSQVGSLLGVSGAADVVDAHVVVLAHGWDGTIWSTDHQDMIQLGAKRLIGSQG